MTKITQEKVDKFMFYFSIIDIMFLPYIWFISTNYSLILLSIWCLIRIKSIIQMKEFKLSIVLALIMALSTVVSLYCHPKVLSSGDEIWIQNIKMMLQYCSYFMYYIMFVYCIKKYDDLKIKELLIMFLIFATIFAIIYCIDKGLFAKIKSIWNNVDAYTKWFKEGVMIQYRYNFTWTDPNNPAYAFVAVMTFLILNIKTNNCEKLLSIIMTMFLLICTMSTGGVLSFVIIVIATIFICIIPKLIKNKFKPKTTKKALVITIAITLLIIYILVNTPVITNLSIYREATERIFGNIDEGSGSRFSIWLTILENTNIFYNILLGTGGRQVIINNEKIIAPHNGHLYLIYAYGMIFYAIFVYEFFRKRKNISIKEYLFVIPVLIGFTINTIIGEQKFFVLYLLLYAVSYCKKTEKLKESEKSE